MINEKRNNQPTATPENIESLCYFGEYQTYTEENVDVAVGGCDFENCNWKYGDLIFLLNRQLNNFEYEEGKFIKVCDLSEPNTTKDDVGQSKPVPYNRKRKDLNWNNSWESKPCLNTDSKVQFSIVIPVLLQPANLSFDFVEAVCEDIIRNENNGTIIRDLGLSGVMSGKDAMKDFCGHQNYPIVSGTPSRPGYFLWEVIRAHERIHGDKFLEILNRNAIKLREDLSKIILSCEDYNSKYWGKEGVEQDMLNKINTYYNSCISQYFAENDEQGIQCSAEIRKLIKRYMQKVKDRFGTSLPKFDCYSCKNK